MGSGIAAPTPEAQVAPQAQPKASAQESAQGVITPKEITKETTQKTTQKKDVNEGQLKVARSGEIEWTLRDAEVHIKRYRGWLHWETSAPQPLEVLQDVSALRRILINAIEREVIAKASRAEELAQGPIIGRRQYREWLIGLVPGSLRPNDEGLDQFIKGRLKMRAEESLDFFWRAVEDAYWVNRKKESLVAALTEEDARAEWTRRGELIKTWLMQIPRVPTSREISTAIKRYPKEMRAYYDAHPELFSQPLRLLVEPYWIRGGKLEAERLQALEARDRVAKGEPLDRVIEELPMLTRGGAKSIRGKSIPKGTEVREGAVTQIRLTRYGWTFYTIKRVYPAYVRSLQERSVQREVAAAVLRERDDLPRAQKLAQRAQQELKSAESIEALKRWGRSRRVRVNAPDPFFASKQNVVPTIGLAPDLHTAIINAPEGVVLPPIKVRQHYVLAKIVERSKRAEPWSEARDYFLKQWRAERAPRVLDEWLTAELKEQPRWISMKRLKFFKSDALKFESTQNPKAPVKPDAQPDAAPQP